ncbi:hypothetical protein [Nocardia asteroides]|uniref:hypothetical protein n=1 Tax=Nocardia asteroides TaxID=1824 RepID=UPI001E5B0877|nr:hypothetical protein [Nocardia asteroides]UGT63509.1 hypothetical protein LTT61_09435 [Nocardia asteroides]
MSVLTALARLEAVRAGRAQPIAGVCHTHLARRPLVLVPLKLAGEAAAPLALLAGTAADEPRLLVVPQPRDRVLRLRFIAQLAEIVLPYVAEHTVEVEEKTTKAGETYTRCLDAPQLWTPNAAGIEFLRLLGRSVRFHRTEGENPVPPEVPLLGRWLTWFCDRAEHPGSAVLLPMTSVLAAHWASGQSALEDANLAALLGWIAPPPGRSGAEAAARAEDPLAVPPAGPATDPGFDNEELAPLITGYDEAPEGAAKVTAEQRLRRALLRQLEPTWQLLWQGLNLLRALPEGAHVPGRWNDDIGAFSYFLGTVPEGVPQPRRDSAVSAVRRLLDRERALERYEAERAFDDPRLMLEHRLAGAAFHGTVVDADPARVTVPEGKSKKVLRPALRVRSSDPFVPVPGEKLCNIGYPKQSGEVLEVDGDTVLLELSGGMGRKLVAEPGTVPGVGTAVGFARFSPAGSSRPTSLPSREETPWTHGGPPPEWLPTADTFEEL